MATVPSLRTSLPVEKVTSSRSGGPTDPSHDVRLRRGIIATTVSRPVALAMTISFLMLVYLVPLSQAILEKVRGEDSTLLEIFRRVPNREHLRQFEKEIEQASYAKDFMQPRVQLLLTRFGREGNRRAVVGRDGWLYYTPGITFLGGPGFADTDVVRDREKEGTESGEVIHADPRPAIVAFHQMLARRGIRLILFPVPDKTMLQPMQLHGRGPSSGSIPVARNVGWPSFTRDLREAGVAHFDPSPDAVLPSDPPHFLVQDTHWTPEWMEEVARMLARAVEAETSALAPPPTAPPPTAPPPTAPPPTGVSHPSLRGVARPASRVGDLVDMLKLPEEQGVFRPQRVTVHEVQDEQGTPWEPDPNADVLLLGDSFTNVFSLEPMGWGTAAGLAPHLALALGRGVDVIAENDSGAFATRTALARELGAGVDRLAGKRVVIWEFASRELAVGNWKPIDWDSLLHRGVH